MVSVNDFNSEIDVGNPLYYIYDLSMIEILIVNELVKIDQNENQEKISILRHDLYKTINDLVKAHKQLSTSSFYRSLNKLHDRGFLEFKKSSDVKYRKATEVYPTPLARSLIGFMFHFFIQFNQEYDFLEYIEKSLFVDLEQYIQVDSLKNVRVIDPSVRTNSPADLIASILPDAIGLMRVIAKMTMSYTSPEFSDEFQINIMSTEQIFENNGNWTPDNLFDLVVYPLYDKNSSYKGLTHINIISQIFDFIKSSGYILIIHLEEFHEKHHYIAILQSFLKSSAYYQTYNSKKLIEEINNINFTHIHTFSHRGISFLLFKK